MDQRKKLFAIVMAVFMLSFSPVCTFADEIENLAPITITSGLVFEEEGQEATFESSRMVYGEAIPCTQVSVQIWSRDEEGCMAEEYYEDLQVGSLGIFSMILPLELGVNDIELTVNSEGYDEAIYFFEINRKSQTVKEELKTMVALPGFIETYE